MTPPASKRRTNNRTAEPEVEPEGPVMTAEDVPIPVGKALENVAAACGEYRGTRNDWIVLERSLAIVIRIVTRHLED